MMAKLGFRYYNTGSNIYLVLVYGNNQHVRALDNALVDYDVDDWEDYERYMIEIGDYFYEYELPAGLLDGNYSVDVFDALDSLAYPTDQKVGQLIFDLKDGEFQTIIVVVEGMEDIGSW